MPRPKGSPNKQPGKTKKDEIQAAAMRVFCHYGYDGATLEVIGEAAGASRALVSKYFGSKEQLAVQCIRRFITTFFETVRRAHARASGYYEGTEITAKLFTMHRDEWRFILAVLCTPSLETLHAEIIPHYLGECQDVIGTRVEALQNPEDLPALAWLMTAGHFCYLVGGSVPNYHNGRRNLRRHYLKPEEIL